MQEHASCRPSPRCLQDAAPADLHQSRLLGGQGSLCCSSGRCLLTLHSGHLLDKGLAQMLLGPLTLLIKYGREMMVSLQGPRDVALQVGLRATNILYGTVCVHIAHLAFWPAAFLR